MTKHTNPAQSKIVCPPEGVEAARRRRVTGKIDGAAVPREGVRRPKPGKAGSAMTNEPGPVDATANPSSSADVGPEVSLDAGVTTAAGVNATGTADEHTGASADTNVIAGADASGGVDPTAGADEGPRANPNSRADASNRPGLGTSAGAHAATGADEGAGANDNSVDEADASALAKANAGAGVEAGARMTKQERVLTLLSRGEGASIEEIMMATGWQQHSVRGFFAGTVKKKLGFILGSSRDGDAARRYRIETVAPTAGGKGAAR